MYRWVWSFSLSCAAILGVAVLSAEHASAQSPEALQQFRFIPSRSTLDVTGGVAGIWQKFFTYGTFGLNTVVEGSPRAEFVGVDSWLVPDSSLTFVWPTDHTLNLRGLEGTFAPSDPSRITFQGVDGQGAPFLLTGVQHGRLLHLVGENNPPCCDLFKYKFDALAYVAPYGDFNLDGMVDKYDVAVLSSNIGTFANATFEQGDADADGDVDGDDFLAWQRALGPATPMSAFASGSSSGMSLSISAVPEPTTLAILVMCTLTLHCIEGRRGVGARRKRRG